MRASRQGETANSDQGDNRAERKYPPAAHIIREPATEEVSRHHARGPKGEEPDHRGLQEATIHRVSNLVSRHDLEPDHPERRHGERRPEPGTPKRPAERPHFPGGARGL